MAIVPKVKNGLGFGSTEFHVLRPKKGIDAKYIYYCVSSKKFRGEAERYMSGAVGQKRVTTSYLKGCEIPVAPPEQQKLIVAEIEKQFSRLDEAVANLKRVKANLKRYKAAVLKAAVEGKLTEEWRLSARKRAQASELEAIPQSGKSKYFTYIIECDNGSYYIGHTSDLHTRWEQHCHGEGAEWTKRHPPRYLINFEELSSRAEAIDREKKLKTGFGRTWIKREIVAKRLKPLVHNPDNQNSLPVHGVQTGQELLERILSERRKKWEEAELAKLKARGKFPKNDKWKKKYKEPECHGKVDFIIPQSWSIATVQQLAERVQYGSSSKTNEDDGGVPVLRMGNIFEGELVLDKLKYLPKDHKEFPELLLKEDDLLFNRTNSPELVGKTAVYKGKPTPCSFASYLIRVQMLPGIKSKFVSYYINSMHGRQWVKSVVSQQVGQANVNGTKLQALILPVSPTEEQKEIVSEMESRFSLVNGLEANVEANLLRAERLRQSILSKAFSGKLICGAPADFKSNDPEKN